MRAAALREENSEMSARLGTALKEIPPPRSLVYVRSLDQDVEQLRRELGLEQHCDFCVLCMGQMRDVNRQLEAEQLKVREEQRQLVVLAEKQKAKRTWCVPFFTPCSRACTHPPPGRPRGSPQGAGERGGCRNGKHQARDEQAGSTDLCA